MELSMKNREIISNDVLKPLIEIAREYKASDAYNYVPGTKDDAWDHYGRRFERILGDVDANLFIDEEEREALREVVYSMFGFVRRFESADGLPEAFFAANPRLNYYRSVYALAEGEGWQEAALLAAAGGMLSHIPSGREVEERASYFQERQQMSERLNLRLDEDDFFMDDLSLALRRVVMGQVAES